MNDPHVRPRHPALPAPRHRRRVHHSSLAGVENRQGWVIYEVKVSSFEPTNIRPGNASFASLFATYQTMAINVVVNEPRKAARATQANRDFGVIKGKQLRAQLGVFNQLQPTLEDLGISAFVHFSEQACP